MFADIDPNQWVQAWDTFVAKAPFAAYATASAVWLILAAGLTQWIVVPIIRACKGAKSEDK